MVVLALDERHRTVRVLSILFTSTYRIVHRAEDIGTLASVSLLILNRTALVLTLNPLVSLQEVIDVQDDGWYTVRHSIIRCPDS